MLALGKREYGREKPYPLGKRKAVDEAVKLLSQYDYIFVLDLHKLSAKILHEYRYRLRPHGVVKVIKPTLFRIALGRFGAPPEVLEKTSGEIGLFFTNLNPAEVVKLVARHSVQRAARPGDKAPFDIIVPAGPTNASPGPIISKFGKLKIPTRVQEGKIWIVKDTVVAKAGQEITPEIAEILRVVGIRPIFEQLKLAGVVWKKTRYVEISELVIDVEKYRELFTSAATYARNLAVNIVYPTPEVLQMVLAAAHSRALAIAARLGVVTRETLPVLLARAVAEANVLATLVGPKLGLSIATQQPQAPQPEAKEAAEEEKKEGPSEEDIAGSLGALF